MWIFTETGFVSAVRNTEQEGKYSVRARDKESLAGLIQTTGAELIVTSDTDYPYRIIISPEEFVRWISEQAATIDYPNFKSQVAKTRGYEYTEALHDVWFAMLKTQDVAGHWK